MYFKQINEKKLRTHTHTSLSTLVFASTPMIPPAALVIIGISPPSFSVIYKALLKKKISKKKKKLDDKYI